MLHTTFHDAELDGDDAGHFNRAAEGNLTVALTEVQVANAELCAGDVDGEVDFGAAGEVLDVAVSTVFGATVGSCKLNGIFVVREKEYLPRDGSRAFFANLGFKIRGGGAGVYVAGLRGFSYGAVEMRMRGDEFAFALVPCFQDFGRGRTAENYTM